MGNSLIKEKREAYLARLDQALQLVTTQLSNIPQVKKVLLFGSYAQGRRDLFTDLDIVVIMDSNQDLVTRTANLYSLLDTGVDLDLFVYTPQEFEYARNYGILKQAEAEGQVLYEKITS